MRRAKLRGIVASAWSSSAVFSVGFWELKVQENRLLEIPIWLEKDLSGLKNVLVKTALKNSRMSSVLPSKMEDGKGMKVPCWGRFNRLPRQGSYEQGEK